MVDVGWGATFWSFKSPDNNTKYSLGIDIYMQKESLFHLVGGGWGATFWSFKSLYNNTKYSLGIDIYIWVVKGVWWVVSNFLFL